VEASERRAAVPGCTRRQFHQHTSGSAINPTNVGSMGCGLVSMKDNMSKV
jgi:hypothetical protein